MGETRLAKYCKLLWEGEGEGRAPEGVVKEFEFEEYQAACGGMAQVLFQELGTPGQLWRGPAGHIVGSRLKSYLVEGVDNVEMTPSSDGHTTVACI